jgi:hypothetical protein
MRQELLEAKEAKEAAAAVTAAVGGDDDTTQGDSSDDNSIKIGPKCSKTWTWVDPLLLHHGLIQL